MRTVGDDLTWHYGTVTREEREFQLGQLAITVWLTGLSGSGKSSIACALEKKLTAQGKKCFVLDGDNVRHGLNKDLGFSLPERSENIRRIAEVTKLMNDAGLIVIVAIISPMIEDRALASEIIGSDCFHEIFVSTPLSICEERDPKGLYRKARSESLENFTGVSSPYEHPMAPALVVDNSKVSVEDNAKTIVRYLEGLRVSSLGRVASR
ncbi:adenylyl-sulfate kinase [Pseudomonas azerbaijanoccidentalis]|jgi:adenylyl-sulfate kinase